jgi:periplasmic protein TonB
MNYPARLGAIATAGLHAVVAAGLLAYEPARTSVVSAAPIMVEWILAPRPEVAPAEPPKPKPVRRTRVQAHEPAPILASQPAPASEPLAEPVATAEPAPSPDETQLEAAPTPVVITQPIFNADYLDNPPPAYPPLSRRAGEQGRVLLRVLVNPGGRAEEVEVRASSGYSRLDDTARQTVRRWKFVPAKRGSEPVPGWVVIPISFRLEG